MKSFRQNKWLDQQRQAIPVVRMLYKFWMDCATALIHSVELSSPCTCAPFNNFARINTFFYVIALWFSVQNEWVSLHTIRPIYVTHIFFRSTIYEISLFLFSILSLFIDEGEKKRAIVWGLYFGNQFPFFWIFSMNLLKGPNLTTIWIQKSCYLSSEKDKYFSDKTKLRSDREDKRIFK